MSGCCPVGSEKALAADYKPLGKEINLDGLKCYTHGSGSKAIIVYYDIFGFDGGRTKLICDQLAGQGFTVILPDVYHGDFWPADKPLGPDLMEWLKNFPWDSVNNDTNKVIAYLQSNGVTTIGCLGFCWGAWAVFHLCENEIVKSGASVHPSVGIGSLFNETPEELAKKIKCPQLVYAAGNDPATYKTGGDVYTTLMGNFKDLCDMREFPDMVHGFSTRGDLNKPEVERDVKIVIEGVIDFCKKRI